MASRDARSRWRRRAALWYVLASSYLVAALLLNRTLTGVWGVSLELLALLIAVPSAQLAVLELFRPRLFGRHLEEDSRGSVDGVSDP